MTDFSIASAVLPDSIDETAEHPLTAIVRFSSLGLIASFCLMALGIDLGAGWI